MSGATTEAVTDTTIPPAPPAAPVVAATPPAPSLLADAKPPVAETKPSDAAATPAAYDFKLPEGLTIDAPLMEGFTATAKAANLTQEQAQPLVDFYLKHQETQAKAAATVMEQVRTALIEEAKADKDFGGAKYEENLQAAHQGFLWAEKLVPELRAVIAENPLIGEHPAFLKLFAKLHAKVADDNGSNGSGQGGELTEEDVLRRQYPSMFKDKAE